MPGLFWAEWVLWVTVAAGIVSVGAGRVADCVSAETRTCGAGRVLVGFPFGPFAHAPRRSTAVSIRISTGEFFKWTSQPDPFYQKNPKKISVGGQRSLAIMKLCRLAIKQNNGLNPKNIKFSPLFVILFAQE